MLDHLGLSDLLDRLTVEERTLLEAEAQALGCNVGDLIILTGVHGVPPSDLRTVGPREN